MQLCATAVESSVTPSIYSVHWIWNLLVTNWLVKSEHMGALGNQICSPRSFQNLAHCTVQLCATAVESAVTLASIYSVHWIWSSSKILSSSFIGKRVECEKPTSLCHLLNPLHTLKYKLLISIAQLITGINGIEQEWIAKSLYISPVVSYYYSAQNAHLSQH